MKTVDKNKLRQRIKHLNGITDDDRATLLELLEEKTFGLVWEDQKEEVNERMRHELKFQTAPSYLANPKPPTIFS